MAAPPLGLAAGAHPAPSQLTHLSHHYIPALSPSMLKGPKGEKGGIQPLPPAKTTFYAKLRILFHGKKELS